MVLPLSDVKVLDFTRVLAGPFCSMILGDLGAEVIKVENPPSGDVTRSLGTPYLAGECGYFMSVNRNKKSIVVDLKVPQGREIIYRLAERCDVVVENFRPGVTKRLGIDYETLNRLNSKIIYCSISTYGETGPYSQSPGYDITVQALSGAMSITAEPDGKPVKMGSPVGDVGGAFYGAIGILAALHERKRSGRGRKLDVALLDANVAMLSYFAVPFFLDGVTYLDPLGTSHPNWVPYRMYRAKDCYVVVALIGDKFWAPFCRAMGLDELINDPRYDTNLKRVARRAEVDVILEEVLAKWNGDELIDHFNKNGIPGAKVKTLDQAFSDPQVLARQMVAVVEHPRCGPVKVLGNPIKMPQDGASKFSPPPLLGQHTKELLTHLLGYSESEVDTLAEKEIVLCGPQK